MPSKTTKLLAIVLISIFVLAGCETMKGLGRDLQKIGGKIEEKAEKD